MFNKTFFITIGLLSIASSALAEPNFNLSLEKQKLEQYHHSGQYDQDLTLEVAQARNYLNQRLANATNPAKLAMVLDIDETSLSNYNSMAKHDFDGSWGAVSTHLEKGNDPAISETLALYNYALQKGIKIFFITGRPESLRQSTERNLAAVGYHDWSALYLKPDAQHVSSAADYKAPIRKKIEAEGYDIILNIGDQQSDLAGSYADKCIKLSNPYYFVK